LWVSGLAEDPQLGQVKRNMEVGRLNFLGNELQRTASYTRFAMQHVDQMVESLTKENRIDILMLSEVR
jgi:hypothetical protein